MTAIVDASKSKSKRERSSLPITRTLFLPYSRWFRIKLSKSSMWLRMNQTRLEKYSVAVRSNMKRCMAESGTRNKQKIDLDYSSGEHIRSETYPCRYSMSTFARQCEPWSLDGWRIWLLQRIMENRCFSRRRRTRWWSVINALISLSYLVVEKIDWVCI